MTYLFFVGLHWPWSWWWQLYLRLSKKNKQTKKPYLRWVVWARCPSSSIATRRCSLFVVVVNIYIYELVKKINKQQKKNTSGPKFETTCSSCLPNLGLSNLAWSWWFETKSEVNLDMKLSTWSHDFVI